MRSVFRPRFGQVMSCVIVALCVVALASSMVHDGFSALWTVGPWMALVALVMWGAYWNPKVIVDDGGVHLVNILRTVTVPWPAIEDIETKWSLTLVTAYGKFTAWAAPAPGGMAAARAANRRARLGVDQAGHGDDAAHVSATPSSPSGSAAAAIRDRWERLRAGGHLDDPRLEFDRPPIRWHWELIAGVVALAALAATVTALA